MDLAVVRKDLRNFLNDALRIAIVGIGQGCRQDDAVGILVVEDLYHKLSGGQEPPLSLNNTEFPVKSGTLKLYQGYETPENLTGLLRKYLPTHVLFIDAAQLGSEPGSLELVPISDVQGEALSTHNLPLSILGEFLEKDMGSTVMLLGIQPVSIELGPENTLSEPVREAACIASEIIAEVLQPQDLT